MKSKGKGVRRNHHNLHVWQVAMDLVQDIYKITAQFPQDELYGLTSQMRRSAVSIPSNIAEGAARTGHKEFLYFLSIARGSLSELETQLQISERLGYCNYLEVSERVDEVFGLMGGLIKSIKTKVGK